MTEWFFEFAQKFDNVFEAYRSDLASYISDASKDANGWRYRFDADAMTTAELEAEADHWTKEVQYVIREEKAESEAQIAAMLKHGAGDRETAIRWLKEAA